MTKGFRGGGKVPQTKKAHAPSMKGPAAGGMPGRKKTEQSPVFGKPRGSMKDCY